MPRRKVHLGCGRELSQAVGTLVRMPSETKRNSQSTRRWLCWIVAGCHRGPAFGVLVIGGCSGALTGSFCPRCLA